MIYNETTHHEKFELCEMKQSDTLYPIVTVITVYEKTSNTFSSAIVSGRLNKAEIELIEKKIGDNRSVKFEERDLFSLTTLFNNRPLW
jgi:hypothetical protein